MNNVPAVGDLVLVNERFHRNILVELAHPRGGDLYATVISAPHLGLVTVELINGTINYQKFWTMSGHWLSVVVKRYSILVGGDDAQPRIR